MKNKITQIFLFIITVFPIIGIVIKHDTIMKIRTLDLISCFSIRNTYVALLIFFTLYIIYRLIYSECSKRKGLIYISTMNFSSNIIYFTITIFGGIILTDIFEMNIPGTTGKILSIIMIMVLISIMNFEFDLYESKTNLSLQNKFVNAQKKSLYTSLFLHLGFTVALVIFGAISPDHICISIFCTIIVTWNAIYLSGIKPLIMSKIIEWKN